MTRTCSHRALSATVVLLLACLSMPMVAAAQVPGAGAAQEGRAPQDPTPPATMPGSRTADDAERMRVLVERALGERRYRRPALRVGQDFALRAGEAAGDVTVVFGNARIEGNVRGDLVVVFGEAWLRSTAEIEGSLVVVGGQATIESGATVRRDVVTVGANLDAPGDFLFAGEHIVIGTIVLGDRLRSLVPWLTGGALWARPIVPGLPWVWSIVGIFFVVYLVANLLLHEPVRATAEVLARRPFGTFVAGLVALLAWAPIAALLAVSIVGLIVVPFFLAALVVAALVGRVGVMRWLGETLVASGDPSSRLLALRSFVIGFALLTLTYMVPVLGFVAWGLVGVFGLGAAVLAFFAAWRTESPKAPPVPPVPTVSAPPAGPTQAAPVPAAPSTASFVDAGGAAPALAAALTRATFLDRAVAFGLDALLIAVLHEGLRGTFLPRYSEFYLPLLLIYFIAFWTWKGTTVGGIVMKLRVVKTSGAPIEAADAIVRALAGVLSFAALGIGVLWILRSDDLAPDGLPARQGWHDKAVGTWVVRESPAG